MNLAENERKEEREKEKKKEIPWKGNRATRRRERGEEHHLGAPLILEISLQFIAFFTSAFHLHDLTRAPG